MDSKIIFFGEWRAAARVVHMGGASSSHDPSFSREAASRNSKVGMPGPWRPKIQLRFPLVAQRAERSSVSAGDAMAALPRKSDPGGAASLP
jgi:hypothetical protein